MQHQVQLLQHPYSTPCACGRMPSGATSLHYAAKSSLPAQQLQSSRASLTRGRVPVQRQHLGVRVLLLLLLLVVCGHRVAAPGAATPCSW
jgi:hypothetical protein